MASKDDNKKDNDELAKKQPVQEPVNDSQRVAEPQLVDVTRIHPEPGNESVQSGKAINRPNLQDISGQPLTFADFLEYQKSQGEVPVSEPTPHRISTCWNCKQEELGKFLGDHDVCSNCGFDRTKIFNLALLEK